MVPVNFSGPHAALTAVSVIIAWKNLIIIVHGFQIVLGNETIDTLSFFLMLISLACDVTAVQIGLLIRIIWKMKLEGQSLGDALFARWPLITLGVTLGLLGLLLTFMTFYHFILIGNDLTSSEQVKSARVGASGEITTRQKSKTSCAASYVRSLFGMRYPRMVKWNLSVVNSKREDFAV